MSNSVVKKNISSLQVLKTLQVLLEDNYSMSELIAIMNSTKTTPVFTNGVLSKYINTLRYCGFDIQKINNRYYLTRIPFGLDLVKKDAELLEYLNCVVQTRMSCKNNAIFNNFINKVNKYSNKTIIKVKEENTKAIFEDFENAIRDRRTVTFILKNKTTLNGVPIKMLEDKKPIQFLVSIKGEEKTISANLVSAIKMTSNIFIENFTQQAVLFKLTGDLAKRYTLRDTERIIEKKCDYIVVSNLSECKETLLKRLLKYDIYCEILSPKTYRKDMLDLVSDSLKNYEVNECV